MESSLPESLLRELDRPGPRYTSYPTADRFGAQVGAADVAAALAQRHGSRRPLSLYVHVPFCESVCYYCACNKIVTRHHEAAADYLDALEVELDLVGELAGTGLAAEQLHLGGGSPTFLSDAELARLVAAIRDRVRLAADAERSIEVDPRTVTAARLAALRALGFNRLSFGVQDTDPDVQQAVHRIQPFAQVQALVAEARRLGFGSINVDLIYGLPKQTEASFAVTLQRIGELRPDRIALYAYAHLPARFKPQRRIEVSALPTAATRIALLGDAIRTLLAIGYVHVGMDHFALPDDPLAVAKRDGSLQRSFQGYSANADGDLIALGVSAIGRLGPLYYQNAKSLPAYYDALVRRRLPVERGHLLDADDRVRRDAIMALMCAGRLSWDRLGDRQGFEDEIAALRGFAERGLVELDDDGVVVTATGWFAIRAIAMTFDRYLRADPARERFSRVV